MRLLDARPQLSQREAASSLGMSLGKVNYCLHALINKGFLKAENYRNSGNKQAYFYLLTPSGIAAKTVMTRQFLARKVREYEQLRGEIEQLRQESDVADRCGSALANHDAGHAGSPSSPVAAPPSDLVSARQSGSGHTATRAQVQVQSRGGT